MHVRLGVPWVDAPARHFTGHGYSELLASGFKFTIAGKRVDITMPAHLKDRKDWLERFQQLGFDGLTNFETALNKERNTLEVTVEVE